MTRDSNLDDEQIIISIHIPRAGDDVAQSYDKSDKSTFQSTSPVRGMTAIQTQIASCCCISIHIPRAGDDGICCRVPPQSKHFNPHPPCGG